MVAEIDLRSGLRLIELIDSRQVKANADAGKKAVRDIELAFKRKIETGTKEWFRANTEADVYRMICDFYREVGDEKRAEMLEKRFERQVKRAKRGAI